MMNDMIEGSAARLGEKAMSMAQSMAYRQGDINFNCMEHRMTERSAVRLGNGAVQMQLGSTARLEGGVEDPKW